MYRAVCCTHSTLQQTVKAISYERTTGKSQQTVETVKKVSGSFRGVEHHNSVDEQTECGEE